MTDHEGSQLDSVVEHNPLTCDVCHIEIGSCTHCCWCGFNTCGSPECYDGAKVYTCAGWHYFSKDACLRCMEPFSKIVGSKFWCPRCAPEEAGDEYAVKLCAADLEEDLIAEFRRVLRLGAYRFNGQVTDEYLNDPNIWERFRVDPDAVKAEMTNMILGGQSVYEWIEAMKILNRKTNDVAMTTTDRQA